MEEDSVVPLTSAKYDHDRRKKDQKEVSIYFIDHGWEMVEKIDSRDIS